MTALLITAFFAVGLGACKPEAPALSDAPLGDTTVGATYAGELVASGGTGPYTYAVTGLPPGLSLEAGSGQLSGMATTAGDFQVQIQVTDAQGRSSTKQYAMKVYEAPVVKTASVLEDGYAALPYSATLQREGGKAPFTWSFVGGEPPPGLTLSASGMLEGTLSPNVQAGQEHSFTVLVKDAHGAQAARSLLLRTWLPPGLTTTLLTGAIEGVTYLKAPNTPERLQGREGKSPLRYSVTGLPPGLELDPDSGTLSGTPLPGSAGSYTVGVEVSDANGKKFATPLTLSVVTPQPLAEGGVVSAAPAGSPITQFLTVFVRGEDGQPRSGVGVRVRKNGAEYQPAKQALTNAHGKVTFTGLGLNGSSDTVDITANGAGLGNATLARVNASLVTLVVPDYPLPLPRSGASFTHDAQLGSYLVTMGALDPQRSFSAGACVNDLLSLSDASTSTWTERVTPGMAEAPRGRTGAAFGYAGKGVSVLFGGGCGNDTFDDTWEYDSASNMWTRIWPTTSPPRFIQGTKRSVLLPSPIAGEVLLLNNGVWAYDSEANTWKQLSTTRAGFAPSPDPDSIPGSGMATALEPDTGKLWLCGGELSPYDPGTGGDCNVFSRADNTWTTAPKLPAPRSHASMAWWPGKGLYLFGGRDTVKGPGQKLNDLLLYRPDTGWTTVLAQGAAGNPPASEDTQLFFDTASQQLLLWVSAQGPDGLWAFDGTTWTKRVPANPSAPTYTLSGTLYSDVFAVQNSFATLAVSSPSGFVGTVHVRSLANGTATYTLSGVPAGARLALSVLAYSATGQLWTSQNLDAVEPLTADTTLDITLPQGPLAASTSNRTVTLPAYWANTYYLQQEISQLWRPGYAAVDIGSRPTITNASPRTYQMSYLPAESPFQNGVKIHYSARGSTLCEGLTAYAYGLTPGDTGTIVMPEGARDLSPGIHDCQVQGQGLRMPTEGGQAPGLSTWGMATDLALGDVNGDGRLDTVVTATDSPIEQPVLHVLINGGNRDLVPTGAMGPTSVAVADLNADGKADLAVTNRDSNFVSVYPGSGDGKFGAPTHVTIPPLVTGGQSRPVRVAAGDVTGDGVTDLVVVTDGDKDLVTLRNDGSLAFTLLRRSPLEGQGSRQLLVADFTGDGMLDAAVLHDVSGSVTVYPGDWTAGFGAAAVRLTAGQALATTAVAVDLDGNASRDLVVGFSDGTLRGFRLTPESQPGYTAYGEPAQVEGTPRAVALADYTGDGVPDLVAGSSNPNVMYVLRNTGSGFVRIFAQKMIGVAPVLMHVRKDADQPPMAVLLTSEFSTSSGEYITQYPGLQPLPRATEGEYRFTAPAGTRMFVAHRGANGMTRDWKYVDHGQAGLNTFSFPLPSTLAPSRPTPLGQDAAWELTVHTFPEDSAFHYDDWRWSSLGNSVQAQRYAHGFTRK